MSAFDWPGMWWCCKLGKQFVSVFSSLLDDSKFEVLDVITVVVMPHSLRILSGSTFEVSVPVNVVVGETAADF